MPVNLSPEPFKTIRQPQLSEVQSFGKGTVQSLNKLDTGEMVKVTVQHFFTPNDNQVNGVGITPDIIVEQTSDELDVYGQDPETDLQFKKALEILTKKLVILTIGT